MNKIIVFFSVFRFFDFVYIQFKYADIFMLIYKHSGDYFTVVNIMRWLPDFL